MSCQAKIENVGDCNFVVYKKSGEGCFEAKFPQYIVKPREIVYVNPDESAILIEHREGI